MSEMSFQTLHHKNVYSKSQYNPTSLCIKESITASKPTSDQKLRSNNIAVVQRGT